MTPDGKTDRRGLQENVPKYRCGGGKQVVKVAAE